MLLRVNHLHAGYGDVQVLWDIDLEVRKRQIVSLVGANGAGKSTLLKVLVGLLVPYAGKVVFQGKDITGAPTKKIVACGIVQVPEGWRLFPQMTVEENLLMGAFSHRRSGSLKRELARIYEIFPRLKERNRQNAGSLSGGKQQMCAIARGLMGNPRLLLIDEMSLGLAPLIVDDLIDVVREINPQGTGVLLVEQDVKLALDNSNYGYVLSSGKIAIHGTSESLLQNGNIKEIDLGM